MHVKLCRDAHRSSAPLLGLSLRHGATGYGDVSAAQAGWLAAVSVWKWDAHLPARLHLPKCRTAPANRRGAVGPHCSAARRTRDQERGSERAFSVFTAPASSFLLLLSLSLSTRRFHRTYCSSDHAIASREKGERELRKQNKAANTPLPSSLPIALPAAALGRSGSLSNVSITRTRGGHFISRRVKSF